MLTHLGLFCGYGGFSLALKLAFPCQVRTVGYVDIEDYCQRIISARIKDGYLDKAPIFGDIKAFISEGYAEQYQGLVDIITAGFPCQPFSVAGKRKGADDPRNMWPQTLEVIRLVRPSYILLENVPALLSNSYIHSIFGQISEAGYDAEWQIISAAECGANHKRKRLWILAYTCELRTRVEVHRSSGQERQPTNSPEPAILRQEIWSGSAERVDAGCSDVANPDIKGLPKLQGSEKNAGKPGDGAAGGSGCWQVEPPLGRVVNGFAFYVDFIRTIMQGAF